VVRGICGTPTAILDHPAMPRVKAVVKGIEGVGRRPVLLAGSQPELTAYGGSPREVVNLLTTQEAHNLTAPPTRTWLIRYTVWMTVPVIASAGATA